MVLGLRLTASVACAMLVPAVATGQQSQIALDLPAFQTKLNGQDLTITRNGAACPPACIQPMQAAPGVTTVGELETLAFLDAFAAEGRGLLVDTRLPEAYASRTLPGAVNVPAATLAPENPYRDDLLEALGAAGGDFANAYDLILFSDGPDGAGAPQALRALVDAGYPPAKLNYYRAGVEGWTALGLSMAAGQ